MSKSNKNRYRQSEVRRQMEDAVGGSEVIYELDSGEEFILEHPLFRSKETKKQLEYLSENDTEAIGRVLLGDDQYERFIKAGGDVEDLNLLMLRIQLDTRDDIGGRPTRSSTS